MPAPSEPSVRVPYYRVTLEGEDVTRWVSSVTCVEDDRQADNVSLTIPDPRMIYADSLIEGSVAEIDLGYAESNQHALVLRAVITKVELSYPQDGTPVLTLKGEDRSILMGLEEKRHVWGDRTVTTIVREVAAPYEYASVVAELDPDPVIRSRPIHQDGKTDLAFLQELATTYHAKCFVELDGNGDEVLYFIPERRAVTLNRPEKMTLSYRSGPRSNLVSFSPSFDSSYLDRLREVSDVDQGGNTITSQEPPPTEIFVWPLDPARVASASAEDLPLIRTLYTAGAARKLDLQARLAARRPTVGEVATDQSDIESTNLTLEGQRLGMTATGSAFGTIWLRAKSKVAIHGVGQRFTGDWYVSNVTNKVSGGSFTTDFKCVR